MLQTCARCRTRRIKCDSLLPACTNCAKNDLECTFRDDVLQVDIPRSYVKSLNDRIEELSSQLALHAHHLPSNSIHSDASRGPFHVLMPGLGQDMYLDLSFPSRITRVTFEVLSQRQGMSDIPDIVDDDPFVPDISQVDRSLLTPSTVRFLLGRYDRCIRPRYDVLVPELLNHDGMGLKKLPDPQKFKILMACAIAAAHEAYKTPTWKPFAQICRDWANEFTTHIISAADGESLAAILLLLIYELADPSRGSTWELLDFAIRTCLQLGWHRTTQPSKDGPISRDCRSTGEASNHSPDEVRLMPVLKDIEGSLRSIFNRPNMLSEAKLPTTSDDESIFLSYAQIYQEIYGRGQIYEAQACPFVGEVATLMDLVDNFQTQHPVINETWLLFLPVCVKHKQCFFCFQEADEYNGKGMTSLRLKVIDAASQLISSVHKTATSKDDFIPPLIASSRALISGCSIATSILKRWTSPQSHMKDLIRCTEILSMFAPHWKGGHGYLHVWRTIVDLLDLNQPGKT